MNDKAFYAGFWKRFAALLIDGLVLSPVSTVVSVLSMRRIIGLISIFSASSGVPANYSSLITSLISSTVVGGIFMLVVTWFYYSIMESSSKRATVGKMALGIIVTDLDGDQITFARATGRFFAKEINSIILDIGYLLAAFTDRKQGLHDLIAKTLVLNKAMENEYRQSFSPIQRQADVPQTAALPDYPSITDGAANEVVCPRCRMINNSDAIFCACCGDELKQNSARDRKL